jgi:hypothetical protein
MSNLRIKLFLKQHKWKIISGFGIIGLIYFYDKKLKHLTWPELFEHVGTFILERTSKKANVENVKQDDNVLDSGENTFFTILENCGLNSENQLQYLRCILENKLNVTKFREKTISSRTGKSGDEKHQVWKAFKIHLFIDLISSIFLVRFINLVSYIQFFVIGRHLHEIKKKNEPSSKDDGKTQEKIDEVQEEADKSEILEEEKENLFLAEKGKNAEFFHTILKCLDEFCGLFIQYVSETIIPQCEQLELEAEYTIQNLIQLFQEWFSKITEDQFQFVCGEQEDFTQQHSYSIKFVKFVKDFRKSYAHVQKKPIQDFFDYIDTPYFQSLLMDGIINDFNLFIKLLIPYFAAEFGSIEDQKRPDKVTTIKGTLPKIMVFLFKIRTNLFSTFSFELKKETGMLDQIDKFASIDALVNTLTNENQPQQKQQSNQMNFDSALKDMEADMKKTNFKQSLQTFLSYIFFQKQDPFLKKNDPISLIDREMEGLFKLLKE